MRSPSKLLLAVVAAFVLLAACGDSGGGLAESVGAGGGATTDGSDGAGGTGGDGSDAPAGAAVYRGNLTDAGFELEDDSIEVVIGPDGTISGSVAGVEHLENYGFELELNLFECDGTNDAFCTESTDDDGSEGCPAVVNWSADLSGLVFTGDAPDDGTISGTVVVIWETIPDGCSEPSTEENPFEIEATVTADAATITTFETDWVLERVR